MNSKDRSCDPPCVNGLCSQNECLCDRGYRNSEEITDCSEIDTEICKQGCGDETRGRCTPKGCECYPPYTGESCELELPSSSSCPENCTEPFGRCVEVGVMINKARTGPDCSESRANPLSEQL